MTRGKRSTPLTRASRVISPSAVNDIYEHSLEQAKLAKLRITKNSKKAPIVKLEMPTSLFNQMMNSLNLFKDAEPDDEFLARGHTFEYGIAEYLYSKRDSFRSAAKTKGNMTSLSFHEKVGCVQVASDKKPRLLMPFFSLLAMQIETPLQMNKALKAGYQILLDNYTKPLVRYVEKTSKTGWLELEELPLYIATAKENSLAFRLNLITSFALHTHNKDDAQMPSKEDLEHITDVITTTAKRVAIGPKFYFSAKDRWGLTQIIEEVDYPPNRALQGLIYGEDNYGQIGNYLNLDRRCNTYEEWALHQFITRGGVDVADWNGEPSIDAPNGLFNWQSPDVAKSWQKYLDELITQARKRKIAKAKIETLENIRVAWNKNKF